MSHPITFGNGCTLEDCHTNLFALTDLDGIKWRKLTSENICFTDPLEDPVLQSFTRCIQSDVLCVWRRVQSSGSSEQRVTDQLSNGKELWIFWYGDEPHNLSNLLSQELQEKEQGSWANGLSYECRTLLYKALHNLIERCLMSQNFIRIGKWFVQPYHHYGNCNPDKSAHLSIQFSFFLHGESTVCASIDIRQHPPLCRMHLQYLAYAQQMAAPHQGTVSGVPVILAPYGLAATLTGQSFRETDAATQRLLDDWRQFYMIKDPEGCEASKVPSVVEVIVAGVRMRYPSSFVLVTAETDTEIMHQQMTMTSVLPGSGAVPHRLFVTIGTSPVDIELPCKLECGSSALQPLMEESVSTAVSKRIVEKVWEDCVCCSGQHSQQSRHHQQQLQQQQQQQQANGTTEDTAAIGIWEFAEPLQRNPCLCCKSKFKQRGANTSHSKPGVPFMGKHTGLDKTEKTEKSRHAARNMTSSFHQRSMLNVSLIRHDVDISMDTMAVSLQKGAVNTHGGGLPALRNGIFEQQGVDSPHSAAPSPLMASQIQPSVSHNGDPTMPTLSPHPPLKHTDKEGSAGPGDLHEAGLATTTVAAPVPAADMSNKAPTPGDPKTESYLSPPYSNGTVDGGVCAKTESVDRWLEVQPQQRQVLQQRRHAEFSLLKRPLLPTNSYDDDTELVTSSLYDFKALDSWLQHLVKRPKQEPDSGAKSAQSPGGHQFGSKRQDNTPSPQLQPHDPYEFSDEASSNAGSFRKRGFRNSRDDSFPRSSPFTSKQEDDARRNSDASGNFKEFNKSSLDVSPPTPDSASAAAAAQLTTSLMREKDLVPTLNIPDKLFESESENSDSEALQVPSPGTYIVKMTEDVGKTANKMTLSSAAMMGPSVTELSRMFPTPPSLENQQNALSPCQTADMTDITAVYTMPPTVMTDVDSARTEAFHSATKTGHSEDWSYVYKPPTVSLFVRAERYAPITLPSARQPSLGVEGLLYKPSCQPFHMPYMDKHPQPPLHYTNVPSVDNISSVGSVPRSYTDRPEMSPAAAGFSSSQQRTPRTPMSYELQSPASNASSYLNKNMSSVDNHPTNSQLPEVHSLVTNVMLSDSILNLFKDHNFNSCTICVCNMNIDGADVGLYLPHTSSEPQYKCTCGFSAVMNRKYGVNSGLFYEDEVDITGIRDERLEHRKSSLLATEQGKDTVHPNRTNGGVAGNAEVVPQDIMALLQGQFSTLYPSCTVLHNYRKTHTAIDHMPSDQVNKLEIQDGCDVCYGALEIGRQAVDNCNSTRLEDILLKDTCLHKWPYLTTAAKVPNNSQDMVRLLKSLQPLLQDAIQKKRSSRLWEAVYTITGPLSWKDFHLLSGRGSDETSEPQPIPPLLLGCEREWLTLDPHAIRYWDKLMLEPHGRARNIAYVVVAPENDYVLQCTKAFFKELTTMYELCRLGQHRPISKVLRDGIMRVGKTAATKLSEEPVDDWFKLIGSSPSAAKLKLYARVCQHHLAPFLSQEIVDKKLQRDPGRDASSKVTSSHQSAASPAPQSHVCSDRSQPPHPSSIFQSQQYGHSEEKPGESHESSSRHTIHREPDLESEQDAADGPAVLVYMVDPFSYASDADDLRRLAMLGLLRCYNEMLRTLPAHVHHNVHLQIVPLQAVLEFGETPSQQYMKGLALSVYTQCRRLLIQSLFGRPLTSFGPAAGNSKVLKSDPSGRLTNMRLYMPPFTLAVNRNIQASQLAISDHQDNCGVLLCGYCLSEDQRWLLAVCTDSVGSILETRTINIDIPNRNRRKNVSARKIGLAKLWDFLLSVMSTTTLSWRLVIGRFGRLGHGELKGWAGLLSRKHLQQGCKQLKEMCVMCGMSGNNDAPYIVSACLVSLEVHPTIHIMTDSVKVEEKQSSDCPMSTPKDASCTHILVFPTSALAQANQPVNHQEHPIDLSTEDIFQGLEEFDTDDIFSSLTSPDASPKNNSAPGSPSHAAGGGMPMMNGASKMGGAGSLSDIQDEEHNLLQQPLAMGFYVSTASTGPLPKWFWGRCPEREDVCPSCFKAALHIHCPAAQQNTDEFLQTPHKHNHPLDSSLTCDVLRYVLEMYNALSWLTIDPVTDDRRSCLPAHLVVLMQLYHAIRAFV